MACGTPVVDISIVVESILTDSILRNLLIKKGLQRTQSFTWERCVKETLDCLKNALN